MQRNETIKNLFPGYYRKYDQDMETLADLTKRAKGMRGQLMNSLEFVELAHLLYLG